MANDETAAECWARMHEAMGFQRMTFKAPAESLFQLGKLVATPGAWEALAKAQQFPDVFIDRHARGDWGELDDYDTEINQHALAWQGRLMSVYTTSAGDRLYVITEADRSVTTLLLPDEY